MNNKQVLELLNMGNQTLNEFGAVTRIEDKKERRKAKNKMFKKINVIQKTCQDPYVFATSSLEGEPSYTCLVCGKPIEDCSLDRVINVTENGVIDDDMVIEYAAEQLENYLAFEPELSEIEIREALKRDINELVKSR